MVNNPILSGSRCPMPSHGAHRIKWDERRMYEIPVWKFLYFFYSYKIQMCWFIQSFILKFWGIFLNFRLVSCDMWFYGYPTSCALAHELFSEWEKLGPLLSIISRKKLLVTWISHQWDVSLSISYETDKARATCDQSCPILYVNIVKLPGSHTHRSLHVRAHACYSSRLCTRNDPFSKAFLRELIQTTEVFGLCNVCVCVCVKRAHTHLNYFISQSNVSQKFGPGSQTDEHTFFQLHELG